MAAIDVAVQRRPRAAVHKQPDRRPGTVRLRRAIDGRKALQGGLNAAGFVPAQAAGGVAEICAAIHGCERQTNGHKTAARTPDYTGRAEADCSRMASQCQAGLPEHCRSYVTRIIIVTYPHLGGISDNGRPLARRVKPERRKGIRAPGAGQRRQDTLPPRAACAPWAHPTHAHHVGRVRYQALQRTPQAGARGGCDEWGVALGSTVLDFIVLGSGDSIPGYDCGGVAHGALLHHDHRCARAAHRAEGADLLDQRRVQRHEDARVDCLDVRRRVQSGHGRAQCLGALLLGQHGVAAREGSPRC
eukprot:m.161387 g.161387  ORF g.161387 m.161387 type:complete len:302 (-) comp9864_c0_seq2:840-1745(-)